MIHAFVAFVPSKRNALSGLCLVGTLLLCVSAEKVFESRSGLIHELQAALADLTAEGRTYLGRLAGEQTVLSVQKVRLKGPKAHQVFVAMNESQTVDFHSCLTGKYNNHIICKRCNFLTSQRVICTHIGQEHLTCNILKYTFIWCFYSELCALQNDMFYLACSKFVSSFVKR